MSLRRTGMPLALCLVALIPVVAHPMGNFSISHYSRLTFGPETIDILYLIDMAEIPAFQEKPLLDLNENGTVEAGEEDAYLSRKAGELTEGLVVRLNGTRYSLVRTSQQLELLPGGLNLPTLKISLSCRLPLDSAHLKDVNILEYEDRNFPGRAGWKEIVVQGGGIEESSAGRIDRSQQLTHYPEDPAIRPPEDLAAKIQFKRVAGSGGYASAPQPGSAQVRPIGLLLLWVALLTMCGVCAFLAWRRFSGRRGA
jgi:nickel/cobalt transporter (NicO) family protein